MQNPGYNSLSVLDPMKMFTVSDKYQSHPESPACPKEQGLLGTSWISQTAKWLNRDNLADE